jgi:hypothetical protein
MKKTLMYKQKIPHIFISSTDYDEEKIKAYVKRALMIKFGEVVNDNSEITFKITYEKKYFIMDNSGVDLECSKDHYENALKFEKLLNAPYLTQEFIMYLEYLEHENKKEQKEKESSN